MIEDAEHDEWMNIKLICNPKFIPTIYHCRVTKNCGFFTEHSGNFQQHISRCEEMSKQKIEGKLKPYGVNRNVVEQLVEMGYLPNEACDFRKTFFCAYDIEALEDKSVVGEMKNVEGIHRIVSISIACNDGHQKCFIRKDSSHEAAVELVEEFVQEVREISDNHMLELPDYFYSCIEQLEEDLHEDGLSLGNKMILGGLKRKVENYCQLDIYGFNSAKYDMTILAPYLFPALEEEFGGVSVLKKENAYFHVKCNGVSFKDAYLFTSPCSLSKYLVKNQVEEVKSIFPYTMFSTIEEMQMQTEFPSHADFYSELKGANVSLEEYNTARNEFYRRKNLPEENPDKIKNFVGWLEYYNNLDTFPLSKAINNSFNQFFTSFGMDPSWGISLPAYAQNCMFQNYAKDEAYCYSFWRKYDDIRQIFRDGGLLGGLVNCYHRMVDLSGQEGVPEAAQKAPNGDPLTRLMFFDFNALYLYAQKLPFPATPGVLWKQCNGSFVKEVMAPGMSLGQLQWLLFIQETDQRLIKSDGEKAVLHHYYYRQEFNFHGYDIDGYAFVDGRHIFYEFLGCYWHRGCQKCKKYPGADPEWAEKAAYLRNHGELVIMRECVWNDQVKTLKCPTPYLPDILKKWGKEKHLLEGIKNNEIFGFAVCDVVCPDQVYEAIKSINFPPVIQRGIIDEKLLSPYMYERCKARDYKLPQKTLIQTYNATQILLYTPVIQFYLQIGLEIKNISKFIQFRPTKPLEPFVQKIVEGRISAAEDGNGPLELAYKIIGNS